MFVTPTRCPPRDDPTPRQAQLASDDIRKVLYANVVLSVARQCSSQFLGDIAQSQEAFFLSLQLLDMSHRRWSSFNASAALEFDDIHSLAAAAFVTSKAAPGRDLNVAPQQQLPPPPGPGPPQPVRTLPCLLTALAASVDRLWPRNALTLHTFWIVQEVTAAEARIWASISFEVGTCALADWVHLLAARLSLKAEQLRQRTPSVVRSPLSLAAVPAEVVASGALRVAAGSARDCAPGAGLDTEPPWVLGVVCLVFALGVSSTCRGPLGMTQRCYESHSWTLTSCPLLRAW